MLCNCIVIVSFSLLSQIFTVITGIVSFLGGIVLGFSFASIVYLFHWLHYKKRKAPTKETTAEHSLIRQTTVELPPNKLPVYDEIGKTKKAVEMQQNSAYASSRDDSTIADYYYT